MRHANSLGWLVLLGAAGALVDCAPEETGGDGTGGQTGASGGVSTGGLSAGGVPAGGTSTGGSVTATGGVPTGGATSTGGTAGSTQCADPPTGAPAAAITALNTINAARVPMGVSCQQLVLTLCTSSQNHCNYYATNQGNAACTPASAHDEISGCPEFTGVGAGDRIRAAGYTGGGWSECMAFANDPVRSVTMFINSVYHRTPILSPWKRDMGYGHATGCDTIDFGTGPTTPSTVTAVYPYDGQTGVPLCFDGSREGPTPPVPSTGWPSGYPITIFAQGFTVTAHTIVVDGTTTELAHVWLGSDSTLGSSAKVLYTEASLTANTTYRVTIDGTISSAARHFEWTFTTGAAGGRC